MSDTKSPRHDVLFEAASERGGHFTTADAERAGFRSPLLTYYVRRGTFVRIARGIYRLRDYPASPNDALYPAVLALAPDGVVSHESALELHGLSDVIPDAIHVTVPRGQRGRAGLEGVRIHTSVKPFATGDVTEKAGIPVTTAGRTIVDVAEAGTAPEQILAAIRQALRRGLVTAQDLHNRSSGTGSRVAELIEQAVPGPATSRYASAGAFRSALESRLGRISRDTGRPVSRLRKEVGFDRLLARLFKVARERWVLKGGLALDYRFGDRARTTRDLDLDTTGTEDDALRDLRAAAHVNLDDYFRFAIERRELEDLDQGRAIGFHVRAEVAGRVFDEFVVDVGFADDVNPEPVTGPPLLQFAGLDPVTAPTMPLAVHLAEKVHAYSRQYGPGGFPSSRVKDLVDMVLISDEASPGARSVRLALEETFSARNTHALPAALPAPPHAWRVPYRNVAKQVGLDPDIDKGYARARALLDPVLGRPDLRGRWDPAAGAWRDGRRP